MAHTLKENGKTQGFLFLSTVFMSKLDGPALKDTTVSAANTTIRISSSGYVVMSISFYTSLSL